MTQPHLPALPNALSGLRRILGNLWWTWTPQARALVESIDPEAWHTHRGRISAWSDAVPRARWTELSEDPAFLAELADVVRSLNDYLESDDTWWHRHHFDDDGFSKLNCIAYFSMEFGIHEGLPVYSGGLGVLAGDHIKSASDLGLPFVGVSLFYRRGYFQQVVVDGEQKEEYPVQTAAQRGLTRTVGAGGQPLEVFVPLYDRFLRAEVWEAQVGRARLLFLDTDVEGNRPEDRALTQKLYGGDPRMRISQEMVLGIGGLRALRGAGLCPDVYHLNEGHCAFVLLERLREELARGLTRDDAMALIRDESVFTTHTPVAAGHDRFWNELVDDCLRVYRKQLGLQAQELMNLGRENPGSAEPLCMTVVALRGTRSANGVSEKHGEVSRQMWAHLYPDCDVNEVPIGHITNGVHAPSWLGPELQALLTKTLGPDWKRRLTEAERITELDSLDPSSLWGAHTARKRALIDLVQRRTGTALDPDALLLGFARRFAPYKRGDMIISDFARTVRLLGDSDRPINLLYAGKAHPRDGHGKDIVSRVLEATEKIGLKGRVVFLPDYDIGVGRALVQGVDVWVNNPRRPREASGTSGQKVAMNGGLNLSTLDGWWIEGYDLDPKAGWAVGAPESVEDIDQGDDDDREALYSLLEHEVAPLFYDRDRGGLPQGWIDRMRAAIASGLPAFNTDRMVSDYAVLSYLS
jgi:glycogen phosphorylase